MRLSSSIVTGLLCLLLLLPVGAAAAGGPDSVVREVGYALVEVAPGGWTRGGGGDADEAPSHEVSVTRSFRLGATEVTQALYERVMGSNPSVTEGRNWRGSESGGRCAAHGVGPALPVTCVTWEEALTFCNRLSELEGLAPAYRRGTDGAWRWDPMASGYRLPTEAEWELAARAAAVGGATLCEEANVANPGSVEAAQALGMVPSVKATFPCDDGALTLAPVASRRAAKIGLYDLLGNVWEWTWDGHGPYSSGAATDPAPSGPADADRVLRGGSWANPPGDLRIGNRFKGPPDGRSYLVGFRIARNTGGPVPPPAGTPKVDPKLGKRLGADLAGKAADVQAAFAAAETDAHLAVAWRRTRELANELEEPLRVEYDRLMSAGREPEINFDWINGALPGLVWSYGAEGMDVVLFLQSEPWVQRAARTPGAADDTFFALMDFAYGRAESHWAIWEVRNWDYGGCSGFGTGLVYAGLATVDRALAAGPAFHDEVTAVRASLLGVVMRDDDLFPYCNPDAISEPTADEKLRTEAQRILDEIQLSDGERKALEARLPKLRGHPPGGG